MTSLGDRFGRSQFAKFGRGIYNPVQSLPTSKELTFRDFSGGYFAAQPREAVPPNASSFTHNMLVTPQNSLMRIPGIIDRETLVRVPDQVALHASLSGSSELVMFDAPFIGVKREAATVWTDVGLASDRKFVWANYGSVLIFTNGVGSVRARQPLSTTIESISAPAGYALASFAGRIFVGHAVIDGNFEPMGMAWNSANADYNDWSGEGSGYELLIDDLQTGDRIISLCPMGLDLMAILCRRSIWLARRTGDAFRPADFQPRVAGVGAVNGATVKATKEGVLFLSDTGVYLFDGNSAILVSAPINPSLLPLASDNFVATFDPTKKWYYLHTSANTWIFDVDYKRWYYSGMISLGGALFPLQTAGLRWSEVAETWDQETQVIWRDLAAGESGNARLFFLGTEAGSRVLGEESVGEESAFGTLLTPDWETPMVDGEQLHSLITTQGIVIEYKGIGIVHFFLPNLAGIFEEVVSGTLPLTAVPRTTLVPILRTGKGVGLRLQVETGDLEVIQFQLRVLSRSPRIELSPFVPVLPGESPPAEEPPIADVWSRAFMSFDPGFVPNTDPDCETLGLVGGDARAMFVAGFNGLTIDDNLYAYTAGYPVSTTKNYALIGPFSDYATGEMFEYIVRARQMTVNSVQFDFYLGLAGGVRPFVHTRTVPTTIGYVRDHFEQVKGQICVGEAPGEDFHRTQEWETVDGISYPDPFGVL